MWRVGVVAIVWAVCAGELWAQPDPVPDPPAPDAAPAQPDAKPAAPDDETIDPSQIPPPPPPLPTYPRSFVERPLMLPDGRAEGSVSLRAAQESLRDESLLYGTIAAGGAIAFGMLHPYGGIRLMPVYEEPQMAEDVDIPLVSLIYGGARLRLTSDTAVGVEMAVGSVDSSHRSYSPSVDARHKFRPSERTAVVLGGGVGYNRWHIDDDLVENVAAFADAGLELQLSPEVAVSAGGGIAQVKFVGDTPGLYRSYRPYSLGVSLPISLSERVDLIPSIGYQSYANLETWSGSLSFWFH